MVELADGVGILGGEPAGDLSGSSLRRSRSAMRSRLVGYGRNSLGSEPQTDHRRRTRQLDAARALKVHACSTDAARPTVVGRCPINSSPTSTTSTPVIAAECRRSLATGARRRRRHGDGVARRDGDWTMQVVDRSRRPRRARSARSSPHAARRRRRPRGRHASTGGCIARRGRPTRSPTPSASAPTATLLQMRRPLPTGTVAPRWPTRAFRPGHDEEAWLEVNNRAFAGHHEQHGWTLDTLRQRDAPAVVRPRRPSASTSATAASPRSAGRRCHDDSRCSARST